MENMYSLWYNTRHETSGNRTTAGKAAPTGNPDVKSGQESVGGGTCPKLFSKLGVPMVSVISRKGVGGVATPTHSRPSAQADRGTEGQAREDAFKRPSGRWLSDGLVDIAACGRSDRPTIRHLVPSIPCLEAPGKPGMELSETGAPRPPAGRSGNRQLEAVSLAPYKKTRKNMGPIWPFLMKAAFCSSTRSDVPGGRRARRHSSTISTNRTGYLPSVPLRYPQNESELPCISGIAPGISTASISGHFLGFCLSIFEGRWSCCGIEALSTGGKRSNSLLPAIRGSISNSFRPMRRNKTLRNMFGTRLTAPFQTAPRRIWQSYAGCCEVRNGGYGAHNNSSGPAFMPLICHGYGNFPLFMQTSIIQD